MTFPCVRSLWPTEEQEGQCELLGPFAILIQSLLGLLALSSLVIKRYNEYPNKRPWKVWCFDVSKQVLGAFGIHVINVTLSILGGFQNNNDNDMDGNIFIFDFRGLDDSDDENPCDYYFLNIFFDTTIGIPILWGCLYVIFNTANQLHIKGINSGQYGDPPRYSFYFKQLGLYFIGLISMKIILYMFLVLFPIVVDLSSWLLAWSDPFPRFQVVFVVLIFPLVMNSFQYYVVDNIIQSPEYELSNRKLHELEVERFHIIQEGDAGYGSITDPEMNADHSELLYNRDINTRVGDYNTHDTDTRDQGDAPDELQGFLGQHQRLKNNIKGNTN